MKTSKYIDLGLILFMAYFAYSRFSLGQNGLGIMFTVLAVMNILTFIMKSRQANETEVK